MKVRSGHIVVMVTGCMYSVMNLFFSHQHKGHIDQHVQPESLYCTAPYTVQRRHGDTAQRRDGERKTPDTEAQV